MPFASHFPPHVATYVKAIGKNKRSTPLVNKRSTPLVRKRGDQGILGQEVGLHLVLLAHLRRFGAVDTAIFLAKLAWSLEQRCLHAQARCGTKDHAHGRARVCGAVDTADPLMKIFNDYQEFFDTIDIPTLLVNAIGCGYCRCMFFSRAHRNHDLNSQCRPHADQCLKLAHPA